MYGCQGLDTSIWINRWVPNCVMNKVLYFVCWWADCGKILKLVYNK